MTDDELLTRIREQLNNCYGWDSDDVQAARAAALNYYYQRPRGDEVAGCSSVVSGDVSAMTEATLAQMMGAFTGPSLAEFDSISAADEDQAALESATVQHYVMGASNGYLEFQQAIKDALLVRNGIIKCWVDEEIRVRRHTLESVDADILGELLQSPSPDVTIELLDYDPGERVARVKVTTRNPKFKVRAVPPENFFYPAQCSGDLVDTPFCAERQITTRAHLVERGFSKSKVSQLPKWSPNTSTSSAMRKPGGFQPPHVGLDESQDLVEWYECHLLQDAGDGTSERRVVYIGGPDGSLLLDNKPGYLVPYAMGTAILNPHEATGISLYDKLRQGQDVTTGLQRALLDNVEAINRPKLAALDGLVNQDDLDNQRVTGTIRVRASAQDVTRAIMPIVVPDISPGLLQNLEYQRAVRTEMGGASLDLASGSMQLNDRLGSQGLDRAYSVMEQLAELMTRTIAQTLVRGVFLLAHETMRTYYTAPLPIKMGGRWLAPVPAAWPRRESVTVNPGMSPGERTRRSAALNTLVQHQMLLAEKGMDNVLVGLENYYALVMDWARSQDIRNPERYYIDPQTDRSREAQTANAQESVSQQQMQSAFLQQAVELEQVRSALSKYQHDSRLEFDYWKETLQAEIEEAKIVGQAAGRLLEQRDAPQEQEPEEPGESNGD